MNKILPMLAALFFTAVCHQAHAQNFDNPGEYMQFISKQDMEVSKKYLAYNSASAHGKRQRKVEALREKLLNQIQESRMNISGMPSFKGDKSYRDTAVNFLKFYFNVMNDDYSKIINMEEIAENSYDDMEAYIMMEEQVQQKLSEANERMQAAQKDFAAKNNIRLLEDKSEMSEMMDEVAGNSKYYHQVYLIFFKPSVQEKNMMEAQNKKNITGMEQARGSMIKYAQEGLEKLKELQAYKGDNSLKQACNNALNFYIKEGEKMNAFSEYSMAKESFETSKKDFDKSKNHSQQEVDAYNKAVNNINKATSNFNTVNQSLNELRSQQTQNWNEAVKNFFDNHTPHYK